MGTGRRVFGFCAEKGGGGWNDGGRENGGRKSEIYEWEKEGKVIERRRKNGKGAYLGEDGVRAAGAF